MRYVEGCGGVGMGWNKEILEERGWDKKRHGRMGWDRKGISRYN